MISNRPLPDPNSTLHEARDFIFASSLTRRAFDSSRKNLANFVGDLLDATHRLSLACHLPEFTDHGLPHLCSLVDRISCWGLPGVGGTYLPESLAPDDAADLLVATLIHDLGMLSQNPCDLPQPYSPDLDPSQWTSRALWVRTTHVVRLPRLLPRLMLDYSKNYEEFFDPACPSNLLRAVEVAMAHQKWPWQWAADGGLDAIGRALAAVVSVADLLDEDAGRCDTTTLLQHRGGDELNRAHWMRHALTADRILITNGSISVDVKKPPGTTHLTKPIYSALRNHFRLISLYEADLRAIDAPITNINLNPSTGIPLTNTDLLKNWNALEGFDNESALTFQLLRTFMGEALKSPTRCSQETLTQLAVASLEDVDLAVLEAAQGSTEPRSPLEQTFEAIVGGVS
ncbi:hypothetical protein CA13_66890 [Planctomycetes bacterium CA13]|uniref:HD-CE domain-containing protein n=1 Tax=Novipirellula herctigrandis TaxID=2527986 RepID=A0A5C5YN24_9BACT|nr:hypothetical protein CA13_66890 [Planctomycetes bacterium CA13]